MQLDYEVLSAVLIWASLIFLVLYFAYRKYIYSIFDPIFTYVYVSAFSSVFVIYVVEDSKYIIHYFVCHFFLFLGFLLIQKVNLIGNNKSRDFDFKDRFFLEVTTYILMAVYILANLFTLYTRGSAFFSDDPYARETIFEEGFGIFRRINWGIGSFLSAGLATLYLTRPKRIYLILLLILAFFIIQEGTKSALLRIVIVIAALAYHPYFTNNSVTSRLKKYIPVGAIAVAGAFVAVLAKESGANNDVFLSFIKRLLSGADAVLYFYMPQNEYLLHVYHPLDFIPYFLNPILGFLHLVPYVEPFGSVTVGNIQVSALKKDIYLAPNTPFYIEGQIYFGYYGAFIYSFFVGITIAFIRQVFFSISRGSYFTLVLLCTIFFHSLPIVNETSLFVKACLDTCIFVFPVYILVSFVLRKKLVIHKISFRIPDKPLTEDI